MSIQLDEEECVSTLSRIYTDHLLSATIRSRCLLQHDTSLNHNSLSFVQAYESPLADNLKTYRTREKRAARETARFLRAERVAREKEEDRRIRIVCCQTYESPLKKIVPSQAYESPLADELEALELAKNVKEDAERAAREKEEDRIAREEARKKWKEQEKE